MCRPFLSTVSDLRHTSFFRMVRHVKNERWCLQLNGSFAMSFQLFSQNCLLVFVGFTDNHVIILKTTTLCHMIVRQGQLGPLFNLTADLRFCFFVRAFRSCAMASPSFVFILASLWLLTTLA